MDVTPLPGLVAGKHEAPEAMGAEETTTVDGQTFARLLEGWQGAASATPPSAATSLAAPAAEWLAPQEAGAMSAELLQQPEPSVLKDVFPAGQKPLRPEHDAGDDSVAAGIASLLAQIQGSAPGAPAVSTEPQVNAAVEADVDALQLAQAMQGLPTAAVPLAAPAAVQWQGGQAVATVAAGVQSLRDSYGPSPALPLAAGVAVAADATGAVDAALQAMDVPAAGRETEGRISLLGAWTFEEPPAANHPVLQRLLGQVEQWAIATAGWQPKPTERVESGKAVAEAAMAWMSDGRGSGMQLTENAVQETHATQASAQEAAQDMPQEEMRFWLQSKLQRAEVVLDRDGQPVRVQVALRGNEAHVSFTSDQAQTRAMLDDGVNQLRAMLEQQGVMLTGVSVHADAPGTDAGGRGGDASSAWSPEATLHAAVDVPVDGAAQHRARPQGRLDLYA